MSKHPSPLRWLRSLIKNNRHRARTTRPNARRVHLEPLEARSLLATVAHDDSIFMNVSTPVAPNHDGQVLALSNDQDLDFGGGFSFQLKIVEINGASQINGDDLSSVNHDVTVNLSHGTLTAIYLNAHLQSFNFDPDFNFTGDQTFTYRISNGSPPFSNLATVTIHVRPYTGLGDDVPSSIQEGSGLHLDDLRIDPPDPPTHRSAGPSLQYNWYIDTRPGQDPYSAGYELPASGLIDDVGGQPVDHSTATVDLAWDDLAQFEITDGSFDEMHLVLQVVDANGFTAIASTSFGVADVPPTPTSLMLVPATATCGGDNIQVQATITDPNLAESDIQVSVDWDGPLGPDDPVPLDYQDNGDGTYTIINTPQHPATHFYAPGDYSFMPTLKIDGPDPKEAQPDLGPPFTYYPFFLSSPTLDGLPTAKIRSPGDSVSLDSPESADSYQWSVNVGNDPFTLPGGTITNDPHFEFALGDPGVYTVHLQTTTDFNPLYGFLPGTYPNLILVNDHYDTYVAVGSGGGGPPTGVTITDAPASSLEGTQISLGSGFQGGCGTHTYEWSVEGGPYTGGTVTDGPTFNFTPTDNGNINGSYIVHLKVDGVDAPDAIIPVNNVAPFALSYNATALSVGSPDVSIDGSFADPGSADTHTVHITWETGVTQDVQLAAGVLTFHVPHTYTSTGAKSYSVTVSDDDNGQSLAAPASLAILNVQAAMSTDGLSLSVLGTSAADQITLSPGSVVVTINGVEILPHFNVNANANVTVSAGDDNDVITIVAGFSVPMTVTVLGQVGTDTVVVVGTTGDDTITQTTSGYVVNHAAVNTTVIFGGGVESASVNGGGGADQFVATGAPPVPVQVQTVNDMVIDGGAGNDQITFSPGTSPGQIIGKLNNVVVSQFSPTGRLVAHGGAGNDDIQVAGSITLAAWLYGGAGDDRLKGGAGNDVMLGEAGDDLLVGGSGRDLMIGGMGEDRIIGDPDDDILIAGWTNFDGSPTTLSFIMTTWTSNDCFLVRCSQLASLLDNDGPDATVHDDNNKDMLTGSAGSDWFFANLFLDCGDDANTKDKITDMSAIELLFAEDIDFIQN